MDAPRCPRCHGDLGRHVLRAGRPCPEKHGVLLDHAEVCDLLAFDPLRILRPPHDAPRSPMPCPACRGRMHVLARPRAEGGRVEVDACAACGSVWLDVGEKEALRPSGARDPGADPTALGPSLAALAGDVILRAFGFWPIYRERR